MTAKVIDLAAERDKRRERREREGFALLAVLILAGLAVRALVLRRGWPIL